MQWRNKPVILLGAGIRAAGVDPARLLELGVPVVATWGAVDLVNNWHNSYFGSIGIYGQRAANKVFYNSRHIVAIGTRLSAWTIGHAGLLPEQHLTMVDCDRDEVERHPNAECFWDIDGFIASLRPHSDEEWLLQWQEEKYGLLEASHADKNGYINSYRAMEWLSHKLKPDAQIVVDTGAFMCPVFQAMRFKPPQRVYLSGALGEMGSALPGAVGVSFARDKGEVLALVGDGSFMLNMQELATIRYHKLPVKIIVFDNDGYGMIRGTFDTVKCQKLGVDRESGLGFPDFAKLAASFGITSCNVSTWETFKNWTEVMFKHPGPFLMQLQIDPEQEYVPRLKPINKDGVISPPRFDQLSPILD
jgi:acetolactate synthase-1/2/3 large subunit